MKASVAYGLSGVALLEIVITVVSLATPNWVEGSIYNRGLWEECVDGVCISFVYSDLPRPVKAVQAFLFIAVFFYSIASVYAIVVGTKKISGKPMVTFFFLTTFCAMIAMATYTAKNPTDDRTSYGYSYILGWISFVLSLVFVVLSALFNKVSDYSTV